MPDVGLQQSQNLSQQQTITPQMQQSLQILQVAALDLQQLVEQEMLENPVLEDDQPEPPADDEPAEEITPETVEDREREEREFAEEFEELARLDDDWRDQMIQTQRVSTGSQEEDEKHAHMLESITAPETLQEHLMRQLGVSSIPEDVRNAAELLVGMVDDRGFLSTTIEDIALAERLPFDPLDNALALLQSFDPVGVGAYDLRDCLMIQLERLQKIPSLESRIVDHHLDDLAKKRYPMLSKKLGVSIEQLVHAADFISTLNPWPGNQFRPDQNTYVEPDVTIRREQG
ncbi:MAG: RNA polymerase sigma-54 factor, partial [Verrucomicrobiales bacterium]|nr:RNA polymerase sigma-54 factor [Verrucomicrobiales bacterium]